MTSYRFTVKIIEAIALAATRGARSTR